VYPFDPATCRLRIAKHFRNTKMRKWDWDDHDLREALQDAHKVDRRGKEKFEVWVRKRGSKKLVLAYNKENDIVTVITGTEG
jgi:hypothetical protein